MCVCVCVCVKEWELYKRMSFKRSCATSLTFTSSKLFLSFFFVAQIYWLHSLTRASLSFASGTIFLFEKGNARKFENHKAHWTHERDVIFFVCFYVESSVFCSLFKV